MANRGVVFGITAILAAGAALITHFSEKQAVNAGEFWPGVAELRAQDALAGVLWNGQPHPDVVIVAADDKSVQEYGKLPWSRDVWATALRNVQAGGAKVASFDVALDQRTKDPQDEALWRAMANGKRTVLGFGYDANQTKWTPDDVRALRFLERDAFVEKLELPVLAANTQFNWYHFDAPVSDFTGSARAAGVFVRETDPDGVIRHARTLYLAKVSDPPSTTDPLPGKFPITKLEGALVTLPGLPLATAIAATDSDKDNVASEGGNVRLTPTGSEPTRIPVDTAARAAIRFAGPEGTFPVYSLVDVARGEVKPETFKGKVVLLGATAANSDDTDRRVTPAGEMPRVEITANAVSNILSGEFLARTRGYAPAAALLVLGLLSGLALGRHTVGKTLGAGLGMAALYLVVAWVLGSTTGILLPLIPALLFLLVATVAAAVTVRSGEASAARRYRTLKPTG
ncbi:MAG TPA: CHASE2 domain-containing protein [Armatimonadaceae bacterium]|nr:CHASE2 domain-containing protein [Armatimonadaceae bacterium]